MPDYLSVTQFGKKYDMDVGNIRKLILAGRIPAIKIGNQWAIPADTVPPEDKRIKSGKYIKSDKTKKPVD
ncbi:MAG TPA: helix-turn-helix domain-containing protein [Oscillospiraceae bacterium]|nr:helix-turn-helix domain-containing protein [Oscillospiraceae bacterium]